MSLPAGDRDAVRMRGSTIRYSCKCRPGGAADRNGQERWFNYPDCAAGLTVSAATVRCSLLLIQLQFLASITEWLTSFSIGAQSRSICLLLWALWRPSLGRGLCPSGLYIVRSVRGRQRRAYFGLGLRRAARVLLWLGPAHHRRSRASRSISNLLTRLPAKIQRTRRDSVVSKWILCGRVEHRGEEVRACANQSRRSHSLRFSLSLGWIMSRAFRALLFQYLCCLTEIC